MTEPTLRLDTDLTLSPAHHSSGPIYRCQFIAAGRVRYGDKSPGPFSVPAEAIQEALDAGLFVGLSTFIDHAGFFDNPSLRNLAGRTSTAEWNETTQSADGTIRLFDNAAGKIVADLFNEILTDQDAGEPIPDLGLSLVFWPQWKPRDNIDEPLVLHSFRHIESVDFVFQPAADGRVQEALTALSALSPDRATPDSDPGPNPAAVVPQLPSPTQLGRERSNSHMPPNADHADDQNPEPIPNTGEGTPVTTALPADTQTDPPEALTAPPRQWQDAMQQAAVDNILAASGLPAATQAHLREQNYQTPDELSAAIEAQQSHIAELRADDVVQVGDTPPRAVGIAMGRNSLDQIQAAFDAFVAGTTPPAGVQPLSGLRELYHLLSGDYEMYGVFQPDRVQFANVNSSTMAGLVANALNKAVINAFQVYPKWWEKLTTIMDFNTLQDVRWITLGGVGELPTVAEGAAYTELTWDDQTETDAFVKKGGYLGITIESIDKDDTGQLRAAPRALAQAAWLTLSKSISAIFTDNSGTGPDMSDGVKLFHAVTHGNLLTTALSWPEWVVVRTAMMKQTELNSGERLGGLTAPKYLVVPVDLENTALQVLASEGEPGTADNDINPFAEGNTHNALLQSARDRVVVVPIWTDTDNWAAIADPNLYPSIGLGFRYGRTPEIFSVASPTAGLMFTNDTLPVKVRFFYATGPTDWRGMHKSNV